jgi:hypothetical protein
LVCLYYSLIKNNKMKKQLLNVLTAIALLLVPTLNNAQAPPLGTAADFVLFSTNGAVSNSGLSQLTGNVGTNSGSSTAFGNVNGVMHDNDGASAQCAADLLIAYNQLNATVPAFFPAPLLGNGQVLTAGVYSISGAATLNLDLTLNAQGNANAVFIFQIAGPFSTNANSKVKLINGALACNVFWKVEGLVDMAAGTTMRGTVIANNAAINMNTGDTLEGRALSTAGAITVNGVLAYNPIGCGSPTLNGPAAPNLGSTECYAVFSTDGPVTNTGISTIEGDVGANVGLTTGFNALLVTGTIHPIPDGSTGAAAADLLTAYNYLNMLPYDIELMHPEQFGHNLVLTPHTYVMNGACTFTDSLYLNARGNANAVFVIQINGALSTSTYAKVLLINGTQAKNVYWKVNGAVQINDYSIFNGTIIGQGAINLTSGATINGRALTGVGAVTTAAVNVFMPAGCSVLLPPSITIEPVNKTICAGSSVNFSVTATGSALTYKWRKGTVILTNVGNISGATTNTLTINPASISDVASNYNVVVSGSGGSDDISINVALVVNSVPSITVQPVTATVCAGGSASLSVTATGSALSYQWRKGPVNLLNTGNVSGATTASLVINPANLADVAANYNVVITGTCAPSSTSANAALVVNSEPSITVQPVTATVCAAGSASLSVTATGSSLSYQWRKGTVNLVNAGNVSGATTASLVINPANLADVAANYNVVITGTCAPSSTSANAALVVNSVPSITVQPVTATVCAAGSASLSVTATGSALSYQWRKGTVNLINTGNVSGATTASLVINPANLADVAANYNVVITGTCAPSSTSANAALVVNSVPSITVQPVTATVCAAGSASLSVTATGSALSYQWRKGTVNLLNTGNVSGATTASLVINPANLADVAANYNVVISGTCAPISTSVDAALVVNSVPSITVQPVTATICASGSASLSVTATGSLLSYQWRKGTVNLVNTGNVSGATSASLTINPANLADVATDYNVIIAGTCAPSSTSANAALIVNSVPSITVQPVNAVVCAGGSASLSVTATGSSLSYQWRKGTVNLINTGNVSGATSASLTINPANISDVAANYNVVISGTCAPISTSADAALVVNSVPSITVQPVTATVCAGSSASLSVTATGNNLTYQWKKGTVNLTNVGNISGATTASLVINPANIVDVAANYNVVISGTCAPISTSADAALAVNAVPSITVQPVSTTVCAGSSASLSVTATGNNLTYQWKKGTVNLTNVGNISGSTTAMLTINPATSADAVANYNVVISGTCAPISTSNNVSLLVNALPVITLQAINDTACVASSASFMVTATGTGISYQWRKGTVNLTNSGNISGATTDMLTINPMILTDVATNYNVVVTGTCLPSVTSSNVSLILCTATNIISVGGNNSKNVMSVYPNPFVSTLNIVMNDASQIQKSELRLYNILGKEVYNIQITKQSTTVGIQLPSGIYIYKLNENNKTIQTGKLISK